MLPEGFSVRDASPSDLDAAEEIVRERSQAVVVVTDAMFAPSEPGFKS